MTAFEKLVAEQGIILNESQVQALERKKEDELAYGEIETAHPGYLGVQDTFYVGNLKALAAFISKPLLIRTAKLPSFTP